MATEKRKDTAGVKTSEFWVMLVQALLGPTVMLLVAAGVFLPETDVEGVVENVNANVSIVVQAVLAIVAQINSVLAVRKYTDARTELKKGA